VAVVVVLLFAVGAVSAPRTVLLEQASNAGCMFVTCLFPAVDSMLADYGPTDVVAIRYHGDIPWEYDPLYLANPTEVDERYDYYGVMAMPYNLVDAEFVRKTCYLEVLQGYIEERLTEPTALVMTATDSLTLDSVFVRVEVIAGADPGQDSLNLRAAVVEDSIFYDAPNTLDYHNCVFRRFLAGPAGERFAPAQDETLSFEYSLELDPAWDEDRISVVAFVQDDLTQEVHQAVSTKPRPEGWGRCWTAQAGAVERPGESAEFTGSFINRGADLDTFDILTSPDLPADWSASYSVNGGDAIPGGVALEPDETCDILARVDCGYQPGTGRYAVTLVSRDDPSFIRSLDFFAVSGVCALVVDDDGGVELESYFTETLDSLGVVWGIWDRSLASPALEDLEIPETVIWFTGQHCPGLDADDQGLLADYLAGPGRLFITGQDIGYDMCQGTSTQRTPESVAFYETYLHASYVQPNSNLFELSGRAGDPVSAGIDLTIEGGSGADNQLFPDVVDSLAPARVIFDYSDPYKHGGIRYESDSSSVVYLSFGFEAIADFEDREILLSRVMAWLGATAGIPDPGPGIRIVCAPNPATEKALVSLAGSKAPALVEIYDVRGRLVRKAGVPGKGVFTWDLRDEGGRQVSPGVYFVSVATERNRALKKLILAR
jgi:hypothetical protein